MSRDDIADGRDSQAGDNQRTFSDVVGATELKSAFGVLSFGQILGHYTIISSLGRGGMGEVFLAEDISLGRKVAIKFLTRMHAADWAASRSVMDEARATASIDHPYICKVYEVSECEAGSFIVLEFIEGQPLSERLKEGPIPLSETLKIANEIAEALEEAHRQSIVHADLKPSNIMISRTGHVKVMDFGLARRLEIGDPEKTALGVDSGIVAGTPAYMAPEQVRARLVDSRSDMFAFGIVFYEMLTGMNPFVRETLNATLGAILHEQHATVEGIVEIPPVIASMLARLLAKDPAKRYTSMGEVVMALLRLRDSRLSGFLPDSKNTSIAIIPFADLSPDRNQEYFCDGLAEELINALSRLDGLRVASRAAFSSFRNTAMDIRRMGRDLDANAIVEGSVRKAGDRLRIVVNLVNVADGYSLWSERFDCVLDDVFDVQDRIAHGIVEKMRISFSANRSVVEPSTTDLEAYEAYLKGRYHWNQRTEAHLQAAIEHFKSALSADPNYALAYAGLAETYFILAVYGAGSPLQWMPIAKVAAENALKLKPDLPQALTVLACVQSSFEWDWHGALRNFRRAIAANPQYATARQWLAMNCLAPLRRFDEARSELARAHQVEPLSLAIMLSAGVQHYFEGNYDLAIAQYRSVLELDSNFAIGHYFLGQACLEQNKPGVAIEELESAVQLSGRSSETLAVLAYAHAVFGSAESAVTIAEELRKRAQSRYVSPVLMAQIHIGLGEFDMACEHLEQAYSLHSTDLIWVAVRPAFKPIRTASRFAELVNRIGLGNT